MRKRSEMAKAMDAEDGNAGSRRRSWTYWRVGSLVVALIVVYIAISRSLANLERFRHVALVGHANTDLQAAAHQAQAELDTFISELSNPKPGERFAIDGAFDTDAGPEYLWLKDPIYKAGSFTATLDQPPVAYRGAHRGDLVTVPREKVFDWMIKDGDQIRGAYTTKVLGGGR